LLVVGHTPFLDFFANPQSRAPMALGAHYSVPKRQTKLGFPDLGNRNGKLGPIVYAGKRSKLAEKYYKLLI
jgi:hypothetical protein